MRAEVDDVICAITPEPFHAVGLWYQDFSQMTDEGVRELLARRDTTCFFRMMPGKQWRRRRRMLLNFLRRTREKHYTVRLQFDR
jgi:hypothetical protein